MTRLPADRPATRRFPAMKNPAAAKRAGQKEGRAAAYFFAAKMYFAYCDLWFEAELRWMTWLLTALSRAEL
jgi:hypothetical protein